MNTTMENLLLQSIGNYTFPVVIALYLLFRLDARLEKLENAVQALAGALKQNK